jgi:hypothetical protein
MHLEFVHECYEIQTKNLIALSDGFEFNYSCQNTPFGCQY